jgi:hypothetical protein
MLLKKNENDKNDHDPGGRERMDQRRNKGRKSLQSARVGLYNLYRKGLAWQRGLADWRTGLLRFWLFDFLLQVLQYFGCALESAAARKPAP